MRLIEHVSRIEIRRASHFRVHQLHEYQKQLEWLDGAGVQVVVAILAVVEMESAKFAELNQTSDDHLDVDVRRVMPEINETECSWPEFARAVIARPPVIDHRRVESRLIELVLEKDTPVVGYCFIDRAHTLDVAIEGPPEIQLSGKIPAVGNPHGVRFRAQRLPNLDALDVVFDGLAAYGRVRMRETPEFV